MSNDTAPVLDQDDLRVHKVNLLLALPEAVAKQRLMDFAAGLPTSDDDDDDDDAVWHEAKKEYVVTSRGEPVTYDELISRATDFQTGGNYWSEGGRFESQGMYPEFWDDYALVTKRPVKNTYCFFSCSC